MSFGSGGSRDINEPVPCLSCGCAGYHATNCPIAGRPLKFTKDEVKLIEEGYTPEQVMMRREMLARGDQAHAEALASVAVHPPKPGDRAGVLGTVKVGEVLNGLFGAPGDDKEVTEEAYAIINELGTGLSLGLKEWAIVQRLVEAGIISGRAGS